NTLRRQTTRPTLVEAQREASPPPRVPALRRPPQHVHPFVFWCRSTEKQEAPPLGGVGATGLPRLLTASAKIRYAHRGSHRPVPSNVTTCAGRSNRPDGPSLQRRRVSHASGKVGSLRGPVLPIIRLVR